MNTNEVADRREQIARSLRSVNGEVAAACSAANRKPEDVHLASLGVSDIGENRDQEASSKAAEVGLSAQVRWHFVGTLQRNKAKSVAAYADMVQSVDRGRLVTALGTAARGADRLLEVLIQVSLDGDVERGGATVEDVPGLAQSILEESALSLRGVMAVAPLGWEPARAFDMLAETSEQLRSIAPQANEISAGMSTDFHEAIACGATMIRLGSKLLGHRRNVGYPVR